MRCGIKARLANADGHLAGKVGEKEGDNDRDGASYATVSPGLSNGPPHHHSTVELAQLALFLTLPPSSQSAAVPTFSPH